MSKSIIAGLPYETDLFDKTSKCNRQINAVMMYIFPALLKISYLIVLKKIKNIKAILFILVFAFISLPAKANQILPRLANYQSVSAPRFNFTLQQFITNYNHVNDEFRLPECKEIQSISFKKYNQHYVCTVNAVFYTSIVIDTNSKEIKTFQMTYLNQVNYRYNDIDPLVLRYMVSLLYWFNPYILPDEGQAKLLELLNTGIGQTFHQEIDSQLRYIVADHVEKGITLALEPLESKN